MSSDSPGTGKSFNSNLLEVNYVKPANCPSELVDLTKVADIIMDESDKSNIKSGLTASRSLEKVVSDNSSQEKTQKVFNLNNIHLYGKSFYVYIESTDKNVGRLHPMFIGHILLKKLHITNVVSINSIGNNRIRVIMKSAFDANKLINNKQLDSENLRAFIPNHLVERKGLIRSVDTRFDENYIKENIQSSSPVNYVRRLNRKISIDGSDKWIPRQLVIISFEGNILPTYVVINSVQFTVEPFISKVVQCYKCLKYGHVSNQCRSTKTLCTKCGKEKLDEHNCESDDTYCIFCKNNSHNSTSKNCPNYENQKKIKVQMSLNNIPYLDAKNMMDNSFSSIVSNNRFNILENEQEFPPLPKINSQSIPKFSLSQPTTSSRNYQHNSLTRAPKKRKITSPSSPQVSTENMFPFRFGPSKALPPNNIKPNYKPSGITNNVTDYLTHCIVSIFKTIKDADEFKHLDFSLLKNEFDRILEGVLNNYD